MKVFLADLLGAGVDGRRGPWWEPWTVGAIRSTTEDALARSSELASSLDEADLILVEAVDRSLERESAALAELKAEATRVGAPLAIRLHCAWRSREADPGEDSGPDLDGLWDHADVVLFSSRSHLVRIASAGGIDAERARLAPVVINGAERLWRRKSGAAPASGHAVPGQGAKLALVAGEVHHSALAPVLQSFDSMESAEVRPSIVFGHEPFRDGLRSASVVVVPASGSFGDRVVVDAALRSGIPVVAAHGAGVVDAPAPDGVTAVMRTGCAESWSEAILGALDRGGIPVAEDPAEALDALLVRQVEALRSILDEHRPDAGKCPPEAAA